MPLPTPTQVAIAGVGLSTLERGATRSPLAYAAEALQAALADAGLRPEDVDGVVTNLGAPLAADYDRMAEAFGLELRFASQTWNHGRFVGTTLQHAAMAVGCGLADVVACLTGLSFTDLGMMGGGQDDEGARQGGGSHGELPHYGLTSPGAGAALSFRAYCARYGLDLARLAAIPMALRRHARMNPQALMTRPMELADYEAQPYIVEPLRRPDFSLLSDGGACILVTTLERARDLKAPPVQIGGMQGLRAGRDEFIFAPPGLGVYQQSTRRRREAHPVFAMAGVGSDDVDSLQLYDAFSPNVLFTLERFGFAGEGEALDFVQDGRIELGGDLPVNTAGGLLSEAHVSGWNHIVESARQIRGEAGERQIAGCEVVQWATPFGDSLIFHGDTRS